MALPRIIKNFNAFLDGTSYFGLVEEGKLPAVKIQTEAHRGSGMDGPIGLDVGMEGMTAELTFSEWLPAVIGKLGRQERIVLRPAKGSATDFTASPVIATMTGLITASEPDALKAGTGAKMKMAMDLRAYRLEIDGETVFNIDLVNAVREIGGTDQLAELRRAMGI